MSRFLVVVFYVIFSTTSLAADEAGHDLEVALHDMTFPLVRECIESYSRGGGSGLSSDIHLLLAPYALVGDIICLGKGVVVVPIHATRLGFHKIKQKQWQDKPIEPVEHVQISSGNKEPISDVGLVLYLNP